MSQSDLNVSISESAQVYLKELLDKQDAEGISIRMFVSDPGTPKAETCIAYCRPGEEQEGDEVVQLNGFKAYFEARSIPFLEEASVDYSPDRMGGQLTIRAPNSKMVKVTEDSPVEDRVNYILYNEVNPGLAAHGGQVSLVEITDDGFAVLEFGGGCQGCSAIDITLKDGVQKTLMTSIPSLAGVRDVTDHTNKSNAYY
ncbi:MAG: Fe-S biogenesis protein NfuA [Cellvibrionaceae bacterium]